MEHFQIESLFDLTDKTAVVTGASKGIGREIAILLANAGANIALIARNKDELNNVAKEIEPLGKKVTVWPFDLTKTEKINQLVKWISEEMGNLDILINNAGINITKPAEQLTICDWDKVMDINLKSVFFLTQAIGEYMKEKKYGKIINVSSQMALVGYYKRAAYSTSKGGITQLTKALAIEWAPYQINVNAIAPTFIETPMTKKMLQDEKFKNDVLNRIPLGKLAKTKDLYGAFLYLASNASDMVTGHTLVVDGGWTVW